MSQTSQLKSQSEDAIEMTYICLDEVDALVDRLSDSANSWFDEENLNVLLALTQYLHLKNLRVILANLSELELKHGVSPERNQRIRLALSVDKLHLYGALDADCNNRSKELEDAA